MLQELLKDIPCADYGLIDTCLVSFDRRTHRAKAETGVPPCRQSVIGTYRRRREDMERRIPHWAGDWMSKGDMRGPNFTKPDRSHAMNQHKDSEGQEQVEDEAPGNASTGAVMKYTAQAIIARAETGSETRRREFRAPDFARRQTRSGEMSRNEVSGPVSALRLTASAAESWSTCHRRVWFEYHPPEGLVVEEDRFETITREFAQAHELRVLASLGEHVRAENKERTKELMAQGAPLIYQPVLIDHQEGIYGRPGFLIRNAEGKYQVGDAKLATKVDGSDHKHIRIQLGVYRKLLGTTEPAIAFLGSGEKEEVGEKNEKEVENFLASMREILEGDTPPRGFFAASRCGSCPYVELCKEEFQRKQCLSLLYGLDGRHVPDLEKKGIKTIADLAACDPDALGKVPYLSDDGKKRAVMQAKSLLNGEVIQLAPVKLPDGPSIHFDVEADPFPNAYDNQVYLWGLLPPPYGKESFDYIWSDGSADQDKAAWFQFLQKVEGYKKEYPGFKLVHFSHYEKDKVTDYKERYGENETVNWLLSDDTPLFDIQTSFMKALVLPVSGYGLKQICKHKDLVNFQWELKESGSQWSVVRYIDYRRSTDPVQREQIKEEILKYNRDDVRATRALEVWLQQWTEYASN